MRTLKAALLPLFVLMGAQAMTQTETPPARTDAVAIRVDAGAKGEPFPPVWNYAGYDEPNYTYAPNGKKLLRELAALRPVHPDASPFASGFFIRTHNLLTTGDGSASLKWGSTNAYTEDAQGRPVYNWKIVDRIFDAYRAAGVKPLVQVGFMPEALSTHPQPYRHNFPNGSIWTGWTYPPKNYDKWAELVYQWVQHEIERYGQTEVQTWPWEVWNEPDIPYWQGTQAEFFRLYDVTTDAIRRALPTAIIGGPDTTGGGDKWLRAFLEHCAREQNAVTGKVGAPLDFISFHPKGAPKFTNGHVVMGLDAHLRTVARNFETIASFPEWRNTPVILGESDPEGCAACSAATHPENAYRNGPLYGAYTATSIHAIMKLAERYRTNLRGIVTWAFEFENQPPFAGFRELATNGIDKPVLNVFRMFARMDGNRLPLDSDSKAGIDTLLKSGVRDRADVNGIATRQGDKISILLWNYHDADLPAPDADVALAVQHLPLSAHRVSVRHYRMDETHSNAYKVWKGMGSPSAPTPTQFRTLRAAGKLESLFTPKAFPVSEGTAHIAFSLPRQGVSLLELTWN